MNLSGLMIFLIVILKNFNNSRDLVSFNGTETHTSFHSFRFHAFDSVSVPHMGRSVKATLLFLCNEDRGEIVRYMILIHLHVFTQ